MSLSMRAALRDQYGGPEVLSLREVPRPEPREDEVRIAVAATSVTAGDGFLLQGRPYVVRLVYGLARPKHPVVGLDVAGRVDAVGAKVTRFRPGDLVFGEAAGAAADFACAKEARLAPAPTGIPLVDAATLPIAGCTALQGLRLGGTGPGTKVLIIGAAGGVGSVAVQVARALGAVPTAVCSTANVDRMRALGAADVLDYTTTDLTAGDARYDVVFDLVASHPLAAIRRLLAPEGVYVAGAGNGGDWVGPLPRIAQCVTTSWFGKQRFVPLAAKVNAEDLETLRAWVASGAVRPAVDRRYALTDIVEAYRAQGAGHARGRSVVVV
ncbi:MAG: NAD(P)-dependent alcohol dehydrogenase [Myxococcota bacterium]